MKSPSPQVHVLVFGVQATWLSALALVLEVGALYWYLSAARRSTDRGRPWPRLKLLCFVLAVVVAAYTVEGGIAHYARSNFTLNVVRCLLLFNLVPPLLALASPVTLALRSSSRRASGAILRALGSRPSRAAAHPVVAVTVPQAVLYVYFLTPAYGWSVGHVLGGGVADVVLVVAGCLYWWPVVATDASPRPLGYVPRFAMVFAYVPLTIALGVAVASVATPLYPAANTLADTHAGGDVFWELAQVFIVAVLGLLLVSYASEEERRALQVDRRLGTALAATDHDATPAEGGPGRT